MQLFNEEGHLTHLALEAAAFGEADPAVRLAVSEHVAECDECLLAFLEVVEAGELLEAPAVVTRSALALPRRKKLRLNLQKYATIAVAACFAVLLWYGSVLMMASAVRNPAQGPQAGQAQPSFGQNITNGLRQTNQSLSGMLGAANQPRDTGTQTAPSNSREDQRQQREAQFNAPQPREGIAPPTSTPASQPTPAQPGQETDESGS